MDQNNLINLSRNPFWNFKKSFILFLFCGFVITSIAAVSGVIGNQDKFVLDTLKNFRNQSSDLIVIIITTISDTINLIIIGFILTIIKKTRRFGMILLISLISITISITYLKPLFGVQQPVYEFKPMITLPEKFSLEKDSFMPFAQNYSYPSNHLASSTAFSLIVCGLLYNRSTKFAKFFIIFFPALIGFTKLYLQQQHFLDLAGGIFLGLMITSIILKILNINKRESSTDKIRDSSNHS